MQKLIQHEGKLNSNRLMQTRIKIQIPQRYHREPVIANLSYQHGLKVNIAGALLGIDADGDGWFDLELYGTQSQIDSALIYLSDLNVRFWHETTELDGW
ncbi:NIL domain-containing protein [Myxosarcina sp. GI1(2024)]